MNLQTGAFGDPSSTETLILFWSKMEMLHYPGAGETKSFLEEKLKREQVQQQQMLQLQRAQKLQSMQPPVGNAPSLNASPAGIHTNAGNLPLK